MRWAVLNIVTALGQITVNFGTIIENKVGWVFNDALCGNAQNNVMTCNGVSETIDAGAGLDIAPYSQSLSAMTLSIRKENW